MDTLCLRVIVKSVVIKDQTMESATINRSEHDPTKIVKSTDHWSLCLRSVSARLARVTARLRLIRRRVRSPKRQIVPQKLHNQRGVLVGVLVQRVQFRNRIVERLQYNKRHNIGFLKMKIYQIKIIFKNEKFKGFEIILKNKIEFLYKIITQA